MMTIIAGISVLGLIALGIVQYILSSRERERLYKLIKSESLVEYVSNQEEEKEEEGGEPQEVEIPVDEIPFLESRE